jgi:hypothetical protein
MLASAGAAVGVLVIIYLLVGVLSVIAWVKILNKAGYSGWWVLISLVPIVNFVMFLVFAFSDWPSQGRQGRELSPARRRWLPAGRPRQLPPASAATPGSTAPALRRRDGLTRTG